MGPADFAYHYEGQVLLKDCIKGSAKNVGTISVFDIAVQQAVQSPYSLREVFESRHLQLHGIFEDVFSTDPMDEGSFRQDLPLQPCTKLLVLDVLKIRKQFREFRLVSHCIESLVRMFSFLDVTVADCNNLDLSPAEWTSLKFFKIAGTPYFARDNELILHGALQGGCCG